jgi:hypothetical protein
LLLETVEDDVPFVHDAFYFFHMLGKNYLGDVPDYDGQKRHAIKLHVCQLNVVPESDIPKTLKRDDCSVTTELLPR